MTIAAMIRPHLFAIAIAVSACGDNGASPLPDASPPIDAANDLNFTPGCTVSTPATSEPYASGDDFGPAAGSLEGWDPAGRWFITEIPLGSRSSILFERDAASGKIRVDRGEATGTISATEIFDRISFNGDGNTFSLSVRVTNAAADGTARLDRAVCDGGRCRVCTARLRKATWLEGETESNGLVKLGEYRDPNWEPGITYNVRALGNYAYLVRDDGMHIIDVSNPATPTKVGFFANEYSNDVKIVTADAKTYAIIADTPSLVVDVTTPTAPVLTTQILEGAHTVFTETRGGKTYAYFGNYDAKTPVYDVTNPAAPIKLGSFRTSGPFVHDLMVDNGIAYLNAWDAGLYRVDFSNPAAPQQLGRLAKTPTDTSHSSWATTVGNRKIALHGGEAAGAHLSVVDVDSASPTYMQIIGTYKTREWTSIHNVMAFGNRGYAAYYTEGVRVFDLSDVTNPKLAGYYNSWNPQGPETSGGVFDGAIGIDVDMQKRLIFVADTPRGLIILKDNTP